MKTDEWQERVAKALNEGENRYRQLALSQGPLPGYPVVRKEDETDEEHYFNATTRLSRENAALREYVRHRLDCRKCPQTIDGVMYGESLQPADCTCGLDAILLPGATTTGSAT